jgi:serine/threonine-protein kinase
MTGETRRIGRYDIVSELGRGGAGLVYQAVDPQIERQVAIKVLFNREGDPERYWKRFQAEARAIAQLIHQNIVVLYDWGQQAEGWNYLVMQYVEGKPLSKLVGKLPIPRVVEITRGMLRALRHAHSLGVLHRDVKSSNIFLDDISGQPLLGDFGIALTRSSQRLTTEGVVMGTPEYLAPEVCQGQTPDRRSDLYSLGIVLYEAIEGTPPFTGENPLSVAFKHVHEPLPALVRTDVPRALEEILLRALAKNPNDRYQDASEMLRDLDALSTGRETKAIPSLPPAPVMPALPPERRREDRRGTERRGSGSQSVLSSIGWTHPLVLVALVILLVALLILGLVARMALGHG